MQIRIIGISVRIGSNIIIKKKKNNRVSVENYFMRQIVKDFILWISWLFWMSVLIFNFFNSLYYIEIIFFDITNSLAIISLRGRKILFLDVIVFRGPSCV